MEVEVSGFFCEGRLMLKLRKCHLDVDAGHFNRVVKRNVLEVNVCL